MRKTCCFALILSGLFLCSVCFGYSNGDGTSLNPYHISDSDDLLELANTPDDYSKHFILTADIDLQGQVFDTAIIAKDTDDTEFDFQGTAFTGFFDGKGHKITNFTVNGGSNDYLGLFGYLEGGEIKNLGLENCAIIFSSESDSIGGLVGFSSEGSISHCYMTGDVSGDSDSTLIGGLVGLSYRGNIDHCYTTGNVESLFDASFVGGLVGLNSNTPVSNCYTTGAVQGKLDVGGLCGSSSGTFSRCYTMGDVSGPDSSESIGGLCGSNFGIIEMSSASGVVIVGVESMAIGGLCGVNSSIDGIVNCYAAGPVISGDFSNKIGGLCGENYFGVIDKCYSSGLVLGGDFSTNIGGLCGYQTEDESSMSNSFWDVEASMMTVGYYLDPDLPGTITHVYDMTTSQMWTKSTFTDYDWDFLDEAANGTEDIWRMCEDGVDYPRLTWQSAPGDFACPMGVETADLNVLIGCWLSVVRITADTNSDNAVNMEDLSMLGQYWQVSDCGLCGGADLTGDGNVDSADLIKIAEQWLAVENTGCKIADLNTDNEVDLEDVAIFAQHWLEGQPDGGDE